MQTLVVVLIIGVAALYLVRRYFLRRGRSSCPSCCEGCSQSGSCSSPGIYNPGEQTQCPGRESVSGDSK